MLNFSENLNMKKLHIRNQITIINSILNKQTINIAEIRDFDAITIVKNAKNLYLISFYRSGLQLWCATIFL